MCIICNEGSTSSKRLTNNPDMIDKLVDCCNERLSLGQSDIKQLSDRLASLSESERKLRDRLSALSTRLTLHGLRGQNLAKVCVFSSCSFCPNDTAGSLHRAFSDGIGESLIEIKLKTQDDHVITCVSEIEGAGDASVSCPEH